jgi:hypothetical protein
MERLFSFTTTLGRKMLRDSKPKINVVEKRVGVLPFIFKQKWMNIWCKTKSRKEVGFMWALWNKAIAINTWRSKVDNSINQTCPLFGNEEESMLHKFWVVMKKNRCCTNFGSVAMHNRLESTHKALCVSLLTMTSHHM